MVTTFMRQTGRVGTNKNGFSLLEMMMATMFLVISGVALLYALGLGIKVSQQNDQRLIALLLAQEVLEDMNDEDAFDDLDNFNSPRQSLTEHFSDFDRSVSVGIANPKQADVTVYWTAFGEDQTVKLSSLYAEHDY